MSTALGDARIAAGMRAQLELRRRAIAQGARPIGWKVGFGAPAALAKFALTAPLLGFMLDRNVLAPGATVSLAGWVKPAAEPEIAVEIAVDLPGGGPPKVGDLFVQKDLARTLRYIADEEAAARGRGGDRAAGLQAARDAFYKGYIARTIVTFHREQGGWLSAEDLAGYRSPVERAPSVRFAGTEVYTCGPWCQGPMLAQALRTIEAAGGLKGLKHNSADYVHLIAEILKGACADREYRYGDPRVIDVGLD